jgi:hypothetical protein
MKIERRTGTVVLELGPEELKMLRRALERASFIDTPASEQAEIAAFCTRALETLPLESA